MPIHTLIHELLGINVKTDDILALRKTPEAYVSNDHDIEKLKDLFLLMDLTHEQEVISHDNNG